MSIKGSCACGQITYEFDASNSNNHALCHCIDCQKWSGSAYTSNVGVPKSSFRITSGKPTEWQTKAATGKINTRSFCGNCGSSLFSVVEIMPDNVFVKAGGLDDQENNLKGKIDAEFYTKDRVAYLEPEGLHGAKQVSAFT